MKDLIGKSFLIDEEEWVLEEILLYGYRCICRSYYSDESKQFYCDYVKGKILKHEEDLKELEKNRNAIVFKEDDEKELLRKIILYYNDRTSISELEMGELGVLDKINKKIIK